MHVEICTERSSAHHRCETGWPSKREKCKMAAEEWDKVREEGEQCKGIFFTSFGGKNVFKRSKEVAKAKGMCGLCKSMREERIGCSERRWKGRKNMLSTRKRYSGEKE